LCSAAVELAGPLLLLCRTHVNYEHATIHGIIINAMQI
jgi:hypothetical protein